MKTIKHASFELECRKDCPKHGKKVAQMFVIWNEGGANYVCSHCYAEQHEAKSEA